MAATVAVSLTALVIAGTGSVAATLAAVSETADPGTDIASYVQGGGSAAAVMGLVYVARLIVTGALVPRPVKDAENELTAGIMAAAQREARLLEVAEEQIDITKQCRERSDKTLIALTEMNAAMRDVAKEMSYWREIRQRGGERRLD